LGVEAIDYTPIERLTIGGEVGIIQNTFVHPNRKKIDFPIFVLCIRITD
jgi:hypothetical protein